MLLHSVNLPPRVFLGKESICSAMFTLFLFLFQIAFICGPFVLNRMNLTLLLS